MNKQYIKDNWEFFSLQSKDHFKSATLLQHHAIQFIAMAGRYLISQKPDDSNTNMKWYLNKKMVVGDWINSRQFPLKLGIRLEDLILFIFDPSFHDIAHFYLQGKTKPDIFQWFKLTLRELDVENIDALQMDMHYSIPPHKTDDEAPFEIENKDEMKTLSVLRSNAELVLDELSRQFDHPSKVKIWPHHFDTGCVVPVENTGGEIRKSIGLGLAVPDENVDYYYFYVNHWSADDNLDYTQIRELEGGGHWITSSWIGAVLPINEFYTDTNTDAQVNRVHSFFTSAINNTLDILLTTNIQMK